MGIYLKAMERRGWSFALVSVAAYLSFDGDHITDVRVVLGGIAPVPWRAKEAEKVLSGQRYSEMLFKTAGETAVAGVRPLRQNEYKVRLAKELIRRALITVTT
jgi:xanthine dehydrogenase YagS FAD-binding subunit